MGSRPGERTEIRTRLAQWRVQRGMTQAQLAQVMGVSLETLRRLERGRVDNPPLRYLVNAAIVLGVELDDLIEEEWRAWMPLTPGAAAPPPWASSVR